jgi:tRNA1(Val) A37 N6-methylase TrmN6
MVLVAGKKGASGTDVKILPPLIISEKTPDGCIINTERINDIYDKEHTDCFI